MRVFRPWIGAAIALVACGGTASTPARQTTLASQPRVDSNPGGEQSVRDATPAGHTLRRGVGWSLAVPSPWTPVPAQGSVVAAFNAPAGDTSGLTVNIAVVPTTTDLQGFAEQSVRELAAEHIVIESRRAVQLGDVAGEEIQIVQQPTAVSLRMLGRILSIGRIGIAVTCGAPSGYFGTARPMCEKIFDTLRFTSSTTPPATPQFQPARVLRGDTWSMAVPGDWHDQPIEPPSVASAMSPPHGDDVVVVTVVLADVAAGDANFGQSGLTNIAADRANTVLNRRDLRIAGAAGVEFESLRAEPVARVRLLQRLVVHGSNGIVATCGGLEENFAAHRAICDTVLSTLRIAP